MDVPARFRDYACDEYFRKGWSVSGHFDEPSQCLVIVPLENAYEDAEHDFFAIGRSGCGGIDFGYRKGEEGLWAYYPIGQEFKFMSSTVAELIEGWCSGQLWV
jgi:hypothetical protein